LMPKIIAYYPKLYLMGFDGVWWELTCVRDEWVDDMSLLHELAKVCGVKDVGGLVRVLQNFKLADFKSAGNDRSHTVDDGGWYWLAHHWRLAVLKVAPDLKFEVALDSCLSDNLLYGKEIELG